MPRGIPSWATVSGLTVTALVAVSFLAIQASGETPKTPHAAASASPRPTTSKPHTPPPPPAVPAKSGNGKRIIYSLGQHRVWVIPPTGTPVATFTVQPGTVSPKLGTHLVNGHYAARTGGDGAAVEHVVFFEYTAETWVGFSAPVSDKVTAPDPSLHTGAIRAHRADATRIWNNTVLGSTVVVVP